MSLIEDVFGETQADYVITLSENKDDYKSLLKAAGKELISSKTELITKRPYDYLMAVSLQADFASSDDECVKVINLIKGFMLNKEKFILPYFLEHQGLDLAGRCLMGLSFFYNAMQYRCQKHGAPKPEFYRDLGKQILTINDMEDVSENFLLWERFLPEYLPRQ